MARAALAILSTIVVLLIGVPAQAAGGDSEQATKTYLLNAANCDMFSVESGKLALEKARTPVVKEFAQMLVDDHTKTLAKLREIVTTLQLESQLAKTLDKEHQHKLDELRAVEPAAFDLEFVKMQLKGHEDALQLHQAYANTGPDEPVRVLAAERAQIVERHLVQLRKLKSIPAGGA